MKTWLSATVAIVPAFLAPWGVLMAGPVEINWRTVGAVAVASVIAGLTATSNWFSTKWAADPKSGFEAELLSRSNMVARPIDTS